MVAPVASPSIWIPPTTPRTASNSSPFSIATTIATVTCRWFVFSPLMRRRSSTWWRRCSAWECDWLAGCAGDFAPSDCTGERCLSQGENPGATRRRLRVPGSSGVFRLRTESGIPRQPGLQCGLEAGAVCIGDRGPNRTCLWRVPVRYQKDLAVETTGHLQSRGGARREQGTERQPALRGHQPETESAVDLRAGLLSAGRRGEQD